MSDKNIVYIIMRNVPHEFNEVVKASMNKDALEPILAELNKEEYVKIGYIDYSIEEHELI
jgi:hypothetical protein